MDKITCPYCGEEVDELIEDYVTHAFYCEFCEDSYVDEQVIKDENRN